MYLNYILTGLEDKLFIQFLRKIGMSDHCDMWCTYKNIFDFAGKQFCKIKQIFGPLYGLNGLFQKDVRKVFSYNTAHNLMILTWAFQ